MPGWRPGEGWGWIWGQDDEIGALNAMTEEAVREALAHVSRGRTFDLGVMVDRHSYISPFHPPTLVTTYSTSEQFKRDLGVDAAGASFNTSLVAISDHAGTQLDGLSHATFGADDHFYNGFTSNDGRGDFGVTRASAANIPPVVLKAVLVDIARHLGREYLDAGFAIGPDLLEDALTTKSIDLAPGEAVFIRTGALALWGHAGHDRDALAGPDTAGITLAAARWLVEEKGAILIGSDTSTLEVVPSADGDNIAPVHKYLLVDQGVHMGELHYLEDIAAAGVQRFCYVALAPKVRGTTGAFALKPAAII